MSQLVKENVKSEDLEIFDLFFQKYKAHYDLMGMWLKASLTVNSGAMAAILLLVKESQTDYPGISVLKIILDSQFLSQQSDLFYQLRAYL